MDYIKALTDYRNKLSGLNQVERRQYIARHWQAPETRQNLIDLAYTIPIQDTEEAITPVDDKFATFQPAPYAALGAPYGKESPFFIRQGLVQKLLDANQALKEKGLRLKIFDIYRPVSVQKFMFDHTLTQLLLTKDPGDKYARDFIQACKDETASTWAQPNLDPLCPPPHSTGSAIDLTLEGLDGTEMPMGVSIDNIGLESYPDYVFDEKDPLSKTYQHNRQTLIDTMEKQGFALCPFEYWHFSYGDQWWAFLEFMYGRIDQPVALYGRYDLVETRNKAIEQVS